MHFSTDLRLKKSLASRHDVCNIVVICKQFLIFLRGKLIPHQRMELFFVSLQVDIFERHVLPVAYLERQRLIRVCEVLGDRVLRVVQSFVDLVALEHFVDPQEVVQAE